MNMSRGECPTCVRVSCHQLINGQRCGWVGARPTIMTSRPPNCPKCGRVGRITSAPVFHHALVQCPHRNRPRKNIHRLSVTYSRRNRAWCDRCQTTVRFHDNKCAGAVRNPFEHRIITKDLPSRSGVCVWCGPIQLTPSGHCRASSRNVKKSGSASHGLTMAQARMLRRGKDCEICGGPGEVVDHNHTTKKIRGILCQSCNRGLGSFEDNAYMIIAAAEYLIRKDQL